MNQYVGGNLPWQFPVSEHVEEVTSATVRHVLDVVEQWAMHFRPEKTWVQSQFSVPSLVVCVDFAVSLDGQVGIYEIDERPCGLGTSCEVNPSFRRIAEHMRDNIWPHMCVVRGRRVSDDEAFFGPSLSLREALQEESLFVLARNRPEEGDFAELRKRSVSTVTKEGDKCYGLALKFWDIAGVVPAERDGWALEQEPDEPCVFKPIIGKCSRLVKVCYPNPAPWESRGLIKRHGDIESTERLARIVASQPQRIMYRQPFIKPMRFAHQPNKNGMYRFFFGYDCRAFEWVPMGGIWMASKSLVVQGSPETVVGPLVFNE